jgi:cyclophilin family peptidyl-prolyl cis-trans isomerase
MIASMFARTGSILSLLVLLIVTLLVAAGCGDSAETAGNGGDNGDQSAEVEGVDDDEVRARADSYDEPPTERLDPSGEYVVRMETSKGSFDIEVDPEAAPIAASNFVFLVREGFYDGIVFHRVIEGFMVQAGDPLGDGTGGPGYRLQDDPVRGSYSRGTVAMANAGPNTGGSQFFIVHGSSVSLPKDYVIFGSVDDAGMKVVDEIAAVEVEAGPSGEPSSPVERVVIQRATLAE